MSQNPAETTAGLREERFLCLKYDNDLFNQTDRYYTQGIVLDIVHEVFKRSPVSRCLVRLKKHHFIYYGFHIEQDVFTPRSISYNGGQIYEGERPFTAVFFLSQALTSVNSNKNVLVFSSLDAGLLGRLAGGKEVQTAIHKATNNARPLGWQNQLSNAPVLNYNARLEKALTVKRYFALLGYAGARLGTLYTDAAIGLKWKAGLFDCWFKNAIARRFNLFVHGQAQSRLVAYNATLQGGLSPEENIYALPAGSVKRSVFQFSGGITIVYKRLGIEYLHSLISPEFDNGISHGWGSCAFTLRF